MSPGPTTNGAGTSFSPWTRLAERYARGMIAIAKGTSTCSHLLIPAPGADGYHPDPRKINKILTKFQLKQAIWKVLVRDGGKIKIGELP